MEQNDSILDDIKLHAVEAPYLQRLAATLVDLVIEIALMVVFYFLLPKETLHNLLDTDSYLKYLVSLSIILLYRLSCILLFEKTIGMAICGVKYLDGNCEPLTMQQRLMAVIRTRTSNIKFYKK